MNIDSKGFSLIELMLTVTIIGILAAIAIPNFILYQLKSKSTEAKINIGAIRISQYAFKLEFHAFCPCGATLLNPNALRQLWTPALTDIGFDVIGFKPSGDVYYSYEVAVAGGNVIFNIANSGFTGQSGAFCISASGDLDSDGNRGDFGFTSDSTTITSTPQIAGNCTKNNKIQKLNPGEY